MGCGGKTGGGLGCSSPGSGSLAEAMGERGEAARPAFAGCEGLAQASQPSCGQIAAAFGADREAPKLSAARIPWLTEGKNPIRIAASLRYHALGYRAACSLSHRI